MKGGRRAAMASMTTCILVLITGAFASRDRIAEEWHIRRLGSSEDATRKDAAERLAAMKAVRAIPHLFRALDPEVGETLFLGRPPPLGRKVVLDLNPTKVSFERNPLLLALEKLIVEPQAIPVLARMLADEDRTCRRFAVRHIQRFGAEARGADPRLRTLLSEDDEPDRVEAAGAILAIESCDGEAAAFLIRSLAGEEGTRAGEILQRLPPPCAAFHLLAAIGGEDGEVALEAVENLEGKVERMVSLKSPLEELLASHRPASRILAARMLLRIDRGNPGAIDAISNSLRDGDAEARRLAAGCLASRPLNNQFIAPLLGTLGDADPVVRARAARAIMKTYPYTEEAFPRLRELTGDRDPVVSEAASRALSFMGAR